jgi:nucleoside-diphosphate-sugar epimerase
VAGTLNVITGGTGLVGSCLILELAERTTDQMLCLVRTGAGAPAERLRQALAQAAEAWGRPSWSVEEALRRCRVAELDLSRGEPPPEVRGSHRQPVRVWHNAAHTILHERDRHRCFCVNVGGTRRVLALARRIGAESFVHMSTAQVAGLHQGVIEECLVADARPRNGYEASKISAERLLASVDDMPVRILRPSAVVGHGTTHRYPGRNSGVFTLQQMLAAFTHSQGTEGRQRPLRIVATPDNPLQVVTIDRVVEEAVAIGTSPDARGVFHLTDPAPPTIGEVLRAAVANAGGSPPVFISFPGELSAQDMILHHRLRLFGPYVNNCQHFRRDRTDAVVGPRSESTDWSQESLRDHLGDWLSGRGALAV